VISNLIFTFDSLYAYHFRSARIHPAHLRIFAAIFAIGLSLRFFLGAPAIFWIVGILHGLGDWFIDGLAEASRNRTRREMLPKVAYSFRYLTNTTSFCFSL
jgi:hypothetical protein